MTCSCPDTLKIERDHAIDFHCQRCGLSWSQHTASPDFAGESTAAAILFTDFIRHIIAAKE